MSEIRVEKSLCRGHGVCFELLPELLDWDDANDQAMVRPDAVPAGHENELRMAADNCPEQAFRYEP